MPLDIDTRLAVERRAQVTRAHTCASCGHRAEVDVAALVRAEPGGPLARTFDRIQAESDQRAYAALADMVQRELDIVPCPRCGARSESGALHRQSTVLAAIGCVAAGAAAAVYTGLMWSADGHHPVEAVVGPVFCAGIGIALAAYTWRRRGQRVARAAELLEKEGEQPRSSRRERRWAINDIVRWGAPHPREGSHVFRSEEEMSQVWREHGGEAGAMPQVDFDQHMVAAIFEPEGTHKVARAIQHVIPRNRKLYIVYAKQVRPFPMKNPASLIQVPRAPGKAVFIDIDSSEAQELLRFVTD